MARNQYQKGDIFDSNAQVIVNTVNCKGLMGKGLALTFKQRYPAMFAVYQHECKSGKLRIGRPTLYRDSVPWILNFPTKDHWRFPSKLEYLEKGLEFLVANYQNAGIKSIAFPKLGTQNGKLSWDEVGPLMAKYLSQLAIDVYIYIADGDTEYQAEGNMIYRHNSQSDNLAKSLSPSSDESSSHQTHSIIENGARPSTKQSIPKRKKSSSQKKDKNLPQFAQATLPGMIN